MYLNTRDPHSIVARLEAINSQIDESWDWMGSLPDTNERFIPSREAPFETWRALVMEARALETILSRWVLIFAVGDDPPMLYDSVTCPRRNVVRGCRTRKEPPVTIAYLPHS